MASTPDKKFVGKATVTRHDITIAELEKELAELKEELKQTQAVGQEWYNELESLKAEYEELKEEKEWLKKDKEWLTERDRELSTLKQLVGEFTDEEHLTQTVVDDYVQRFKQHIKE